MRTRRARATGRLCARVLVPISNAVFHVLFLDGVYREHGTGAVKVRCVKGPTSAELTELAQARQQAATAQLAWLFATEDLRAKRRLI
jgi:hypothetical protein